MLAARYTNINKTDMVPALKEQGFSEVQGNRDSFSKEINSPLSLPKKLFHVSSLFPQYFTSFMKLIEMYCNLPTSLSFFDYELLENLFVIPDFLGQ